MPRLCIDLCTDTQRIQKVRSTRSSLENNAGNLGKCSMGRYANHDWTEGETVGTPQLTYPGRAPSSTQDIGLDHVYNLPHSAAINGALMRTRKRRGVVKKVVYPTMTKTPNVSIVR
jgi:hypothetical protein